MKTIASCRVLTGTLMLLVVTGLFGCVVSAPKTFTERVAAGYTGLSLTNDTAAILVNAGTVTKEDGRAVLQRTREARELLDVASALPGSAGEDHLLTALDLLRIAQERLCAERMHEPNCAYLMQRARP